VQGFLFVVDRRGRVGRVEESERSMGGGAFCKRWSVIMAPEISLNIMTRVYHPRILRVSRSCKEKPVMILVDGGSTHNFIKSMFVEGLNLVATEISGFQEMVGSGSSLECHVKYTEVPIQL